MQKPQLNVTLAARSRRLSAFLIPLLPESNNHFASRSDPDEGRRTPSSAGMTRGTSTAAAAMPTSSSAPTATTAGPRNNCSIFRRMDHFFFPSKRRQRKESYRNRRIQSTQQYLRINCRKKREKTSEAVNVALRSVRVDSQVSLLVLRSPSSGWTMATAASPLPEPRKPLYTFGVPWPEFNEGLFYTDAVPSIHPAPTLIAFYSTRYQHSAPLEGWLQRIRNGQVSIDGQVVTDPDAILRVGSIVVYHRLPWREPHAPYALEVLYEDGDMVAVNKPSGLQVLPGGLFQQRTVLKQLHWNLWKVNSLSQCSGEKVTGESSPVPVHRLGRGTSGILLCAKTKHAKTCLSASFAIGTSLVEDKRQSKQKLGNGQRISKFYRALVTGLLENNEVVIKQPIGVVHYPGVAKGLYAATPSGKSALSKVCVIKKDVQEKRTLVQVEIHSGRPHQIRIHLAFIGHPLFGDPLYDVGGQPKLFESEEIDSGFEEDGGYKKPTRPVPGDCGYYLHAYRIILYHPSTNEIVDITAPLPPALQTLDEMGIEELQTKEGQLIISGNSC